MENYISRAPPRPERLRVAIDEIALEIAETLDWDEAVQAVLGIAETALGADAVALWTADPNARVLNLAAYRSPPEQDIAEHLPALQQVSFDAELYIAKAAREETLVAIDDLRHPSSGQQST